MKEKQVIKGTPDQRRLCDHCNEEISESDLWYPFFDISRCGGGILYLCARCTVERVISSIETDKNDMLEKVEKTKSEKDNLLSDGFMNFFSVFPISPIHWVKGYALDDEVNEIKQMIAEIEKNAQKPQSTNTNI